MATTSRIAEPATRETPRVVRNPNILGGEPTIAGTRVPVRSVVINYQEDQDVSAVCRALALDPDAVRQALAFYERNREEIDFEIAENDRLANSPDQD